MKPELTRLIYSGKLLSKDEIKTYSLIKIFGAQLTG
jgi:hypothetical protein